jgi:hypothetical protein
MLYDSKTLLHEGIKISGISLSPHRWIMQHCVITIQQSLNIENDMDIVRW